MQKVYIKGMVCNRCISTVKNELESIGLQLLDIHLGEVTLTADTLITDHKIIEEKLQPFGFTLLQDKRHKLVADVKKLVEELYSGDFDFPIHFRFSLFIAEKLHRDYDVISATFSTVEKITLEKFIIDFRIKKIKEFLVYTDQTLATISYRLGFSSVAHLSRQFKTYTGFNPSYYRLLKEEKIRVADRDQ